jgi:hypothetical protein
MRGSFVRAFALLSLAMKTVRICLLLLLAVLLPIRGAVAAAMVCPVAGTGSQTEVRVHDHAIGHHEVGSTGNTDHSMHHEDGAGGDGHDGAASASDKCDLCSAFCSIPPLIETLPAAFKLPDAAAATFPPFSARAPSFLSDGPERPPRSI